jgi:signal transduction histidine kinase
MLKVHDLDKLLPYIIESVTNAVNPEFSAIYLAQEGDYVLKAWRKINPEPPYGSIASNHPIINVLRNVGPIVFYEEMKDSMPGISLPLHLLISLNIDNRLVGVLLLGKKMDGDMYSSDDLDVFEILARQAALAIDYCMYNREFQNSQRKIYGDELRASVTGMAKTVAHQMVNQLSKFSMPAQYLVMETEKFQEDNAHLIKANPALKNAIDEVLRVSRGIEVNVHKAANMLDKMNYFVKFQSEIVHAHESLDICQLIDLSIIEVRKKHVLQNVAINVSLPGDARIYGIKSMVYDTMFNLLDNAYDAVDLSAEIHSQKEIAEPYKPVIAVTMEEQNDKSVISVSDNGIGINGKIRDKICNPFFTSKSSATASIGIGLYMVKCMVEEIHKGKLWFESEYGVGSSFCVSFPHNKS